MAKIGHPPASRPKTAPQIPHNPSKSLMASAQVPQEPQKRRQKPPKTATPIEKREKSHRKSQKVTKSHTPQRALCLAMELYQKNAPGKCQKVPKSAIQLSPLPSFTLSRSPRSARSHVPRPLRLLGVSFRPFPENAKKVLKSTQKCSRLSLPIAGQWRSFSEKHPKEVTKSNRK